DFTKNCIFIDKSVLYINMQNNYAWSRKPERTFFFNLPQRAASHTIIGVMSTKYVICIALRKFPPHTPTENTKKYAKKNKGKKNSVEEEVDTTTSAHYTKFINEPLDIQNDMGDIKGPYMIMDNCFTHGSKFIQNKILRRGYKLVYFPI
ncbi:hypothetical protein CLU79DRAFT_695547, partial [Phycomyces nitens]